MIQDSSKSYGSITKIFHWSLAILFIHQFLKVFERINDGENIVSLLLPSWHGSIGNILFILVIFRIIWSISQSNNRKKEHEHGQGMVKLGHFMLYIFMLLTPLSAMFLMIGKGRGLNIFGVEVYPKGPEIENLAYLGTFHSPIALIFIVLVLGHIFFAFYHQFVKKEDFLEKII